MTQWLGVKQCKSTNDIWYIKIWKPGLLDKESTACYLRTPVDRCLSKIFKYLQNCGNYLIVRNLSEIHLSMSCASHSANRKLPFSRGGLVNIVQKSSMCWHALFPMFLQCFDILALIMIIFNSAQFSLFLLISTLSQDVYFLFWNPLWNGLYRF